MSTQSLLGGALAVQVALAVFTWWPSSSTVSEPTPLVPSGGNSITALTVTPKGDAATTVSLVDDGGTWKVASAAGYPADAAKVGEVIDALATIQLRAPIATRAVSHEALGVSDANYDKKITFTASGTEHTVLLGAAESKAVHLRVDGSDDVYQVKGLSAWTFKDNARGYLPGTYIELDPATLTTLVVTTPLGTQAFTKADGVWAVDGDPTLAAVPSALDALVDKFAKVRLSDVVGKTAEPSFGLTPASVRLAWSTKDAPGGLAVGAEADGRIYVKSDDSAWVVQAPSYGLKDLATLDPASLVTPSAPAEAP